MAKTEYWTADPEVHKFVRDVAAEHHPHLTDANIAVLFRSPAARYEGRLTLATARRGTPSERALSTTEPDFVITIASEPWTEATEAQRLALIDHELCHCVGNSEDGWAMRGHDVEEFTEIVERHGLWKDDLDSFGGAVKAQLDMFEPVRRLRAIGATVTAHEAAQ